MKLQFKVQQYQTDAVDAVVDVFAGQPRIDGVSYRIDPGKAKPAAPGQIFVPNETPDAGLRNADIELTTDALVENLNKVQHARRLPRSTKLATSKASAPGTPNLDVEMETGTGKTYVYIKTIMEMHKRYGWSKYIVVVPSVAIREGVKKSFDVTAEHFQAAYGTKPRTFIYNSSQLHELEGFSANAGVQVMIINIQAFNARGKDQRRIYDELDDFQSRRPIDVIKANRPIVIIDEPQKIGGDKSLAALGEFNALAVLRYSATHRVNHDKVHRLDALDAYNQKLVKRIAVRGITVKGLAGTSAYLYVDTIEIVKGSTPRARVELEVQTKTGPIKRLVRWVSKGTNLHDLSSGVEAYKGLIVTDVDVNRNVIELGNGNTVVAGQLADTDVTEETKRRIQIREVIRAHMDKERDLFASGIKILSLFFIDEVVKYRDYARDDTLGIYARIFEEEYVAIRDEMLGELPLDPDYTAYLNRDSVNAVHEGYFSIDKKSSHIVDGDISKTGDTKGESKDVDAYDLILKDKERLLSLDEPVRFIFSHSALREGWDNPNVFVMGMLKKSDNTISRRQEVGRGLRIAVNQNGERMDAASVGERVHEINELCVVTDESYSEFVTGLQKEISSSLSARPRKATFEFFQGRHVTDAATGERHEITEEQAKKLIQWLTKHDFIDYDFELTDEWRNRDQLSTIPDMPAELQPHFYEVAALIDALDTELPPPDDDRKLKKLEPNDNLDRKEFQALWMRINHRAVYQVDFDSDELIDKCAHAIDKHLVVDKLHYVVQAGSQHETIEAVDLAKGTGFGQTSISTTTETISAGSQVRYDLIGEIAEKTLLTRRTARKILGGIAPGTFAQFRQNPEQFITECARLINEQKATAIVEHLVYDTIGESFDSAIFTENQTRQPLWPADKPLQRHIYDHVVTDSNVEREFVEQLDKSSEVAVYAKLPGGFFIPTPVGDYNPDWAIAFTEGSVKHVYFVAETKGSLSSLQLSGVEAAKIECARKFFASLNSTSTDDVTYDVVTDYSQLMQLVTS